MFDGKDYIETVEDTGPITKYLIWNRHKFIIEMKYPSIHMAGVGKNWDEEWVRVSTPQSSPP